jgi:hypothetical protein
MNNVRLVLPEILAHGISGRKTIYAIKECPGISKKHLRNFGATAPEVNYLMTVLIKQLREIFHNSLFAAELPIFVVN